MICIHSYNEPSARLSTADIAARGLRLLGAYAVAEGTAQDEAGLPRRFIDIFEMAEGAKPAAPVSDGEFFALAALTERMAAGAKPVAEDFSAGDLFMVQANALPEKSDDFVAFYGDRHIEDIVTLDGFLSGRLYRPQPMLTHAFVSLWPLSGHELAKASLVAARTVPGRLPPNEASDRATSRSGFYARRP